MLIFALLSFIILPQEAHADLAPAAEVAMSQAVIEYHSHHYEAAGAILNKLLDEDPGRVEFLELRGLVERAAGHDDAAIGTYKKLLLARAGGEHGTTGPYHFELGQIYFRKKDFTKAYGEFRESLLSGYNAGASRFFLGVSSIHLEKWSYARKFLEEFEKNPVPQFHPAAKFYLAQAYSRLNDASMANEVYVEAHDLAKEAQGDLDSDDEARSYASQIIQSTDKILGPLSKPRVIGSVTGQFGYDTNLLAIPDSVTSPFQTTGKSSPEVTLSGEVGYSTNALDSYQLVPEYRFNGNYATTTASSAGDFASNSVALFVNRHPLSSFAYGVKVEGDYVFNNTHDPIKNSYSYHPFLWATAVGPYFKARINPTWIWGGELFGLYQHFENDQDTTPPLAQSGPVLHFKGYVRTTQITPWWNPVANTGLDWDRSSGTQYRSFAPFAGVSNGFQFNDKTRAELGASLSFPFYGNAQPYRADTTLSGNLDLSRALGKRLSGLLGVQYFKNSSNSKANSAAFAYSRWVFSGGATWSLL